MFTGIVTDVGEIVSLTPTAQGQLHRLRIACRYDRATIADGASIACNGVCLTVVASGVDGGKTWFDVDAAAETLGMTTAKHWGVGTQAQSRARAQDRRRTRRPYRRRPCRRRSPPSSARDDLPDMARFELATHARAGALHRAEGLGDAGWRVADREYGRGRRLFGADHSAYARCDDAQRLAARQRGQYRGRSDGTLRRAAVRK